MKALGYLAVLMMVLTPLASSKDLPTVRPEIVGMSSERLARIKPLLQRYVDEGKVAGIQTLIARKGKIVHFEQVGKLDLDTHSALREDSLFRIYSMTKPITTTAAMILYEEGKLQLDDPVEKYLPAFKNKKVLVDGELVDATHAITIRELMSHTAGLTYGIFGNSVIDQKYRVAMFGEGHQFSFNNTTINADASKIKTLDDLVSAIGPIPLQYQPGTQWVYSLSVDILGAVIEKVSGQSLDAFMLERLFKPLRMNDTFFEVPKEKLQRFGTLQAKDAGGKLMVIDRPKTSDFANNVTFFSGGGGLVSSAMDYLRYSQMMLNGGELDGIRILSPTTIDLMTRDQLTQSARLGYDPRPGIMGDVSFGLGFGLAVKAPRVRSGSKGSYRWAGIAGTDFWIDPKEDLTAMILVQMMGYPPALRNEFKTLVYQAITEMD
ncbi:MAG: Esterase EstB [Porticoccaceae bacterium UBA1117]|nr:serine hydrolase [Porticoccaceae bacterium]CAI8271104.1 MAG: Esterase EstB [Porticoccaceae bacterium UBA1117]